MFVEVSLKLLAFGILFVFKGSEWNTASARSNPSYCCLPLLPGEVAKSTSWKPKTKKKKELPFKIAISLKWLEPENYIADYRIGQIWSHFQFMKTLFIQRLNALVAEGGNSRNL